MQAFPITHSQTLIGTWSTYGIYNCALWHWHAINNYQTKSIKHYKCSWITGQVKNVTLARMYSFQSEALEAYGQVDGEQHSKSSQEIGTNCFPGYHRCMILHMRMETYTSEYKLYSWGLTWDLIPVPAAASASTSAQICCLFSLSASDSLIMR